MDLKALNNRESYKYLKQRPVFKARQLSNPFNTGVKQKRLSKDTVIFSNKKPAAQLKQSLLGKLLTFTGVKATKEDVEKYLGDYNDYANTAKLHNKLLYSFGDPASMDQAIADHQKRTGQTKKEFFEEVKKTMFNIFDKLMASPVVVVEGTKLNDFSFLNEEKYKPIQQIYLDILDRPETFNRFIFDSDEQKLKRVLSDEDIEHKTADLKHIINDILPGILKNKTFVLQDPTDLHKLLADEVVQSLILEKLYDEHPEDYEDPFENPDLWADKDSTVKHDHTHKHHDHKHDGMENHDHGHKHHEHRSKPQERMESALNLLNDIHKKFDITLVSKVPDSYYDPVNKDKEAHHTPDNYYDNKALGLRQQPRNFFEAKFLNQAAKDIKGYKPQNTVIVTPKGASKDIVEKLKVLNKDYLYIEDWLYKYCLGDQQTKDAILKDLNTASDTKSVAEFKKLAGELDDYLNNFVTVYDIKNPEKAEKLKKVMVDYSKINCMAELSRGYFLGVGEDAKDLIKTLLGLALFGHVAEHAAEASGVGFIINLSNTTMSVSDDVLDACKNYLKWKKELGDEKAKELLHSTISHSLTISLPTLALKLSPEDGALSHLLFRNASSGSTYAIVISTMVQYYNKLEELIEKGVRTIPEDIKDDPDKVAKWKLTEAWKGFAAHSLNRGTFMGLAVSQPFALVAQPLMKLVMPIGGRPVVIALAGTLECWTSNIYLLLDSSRWDKFTKNLKKLFVKNKKAEMTSEQYLELRKSTTTKIIESSVGQAGVGAGISVAKHFPKRLAAGIKKAYMGAFGVVSKTIGGVISGICQKWLDRKYNKMSDEEKEKLKDHSHGHGHAHIH